MTAPRNPLRASVVLESEGMYLALFDRQSPANDPAHYPAALEAMREAERQSDLPGVWVFNAYWSRLAAQGHLLVWLLLFDGVFRVEVALSAAETRPDGLQLERWISDPEDPPRLTVPSGELIVCSLHRLGDPAAETCLSVPAGEYCVSLYGNDAAQSRHEFLTGIAAYPADDGPDWLLQLQPE